MRTAAALCCSLLLLQVACAAPFAYLSYAAIHWRLSELAAQYPHLLRLYSAQDEFGLPHVGTCSQLNSSLDTVGTDAPCTVWIVEMTNRSSLASDPARPEMLVSGEVHGDEIIGPQAVLAFIEFMVSRYSDDPYTRGMLDSRIVTFIPMTNALGFFNGERVERHKGEADDGSAILIDPNRDFGFDQNPLQCMQTVAARTINELFRVHLFRVLITFHGGTNAIGYEWGDKSHCTGKNCKPAPDSAIMDALAQRMSNFSGPAGSFEAAYPVGNMGELVYPVNGGMEDWAYGASWSGEGVTCKPKNLHGYPAARTKYNDATHRCVTFLVETAAEKAPSAASLGTDADMLSKGGAGDGHVPRNVRLLISAMDSLEPYVVFEPDLNATDDGVSVTWKMGGSFSVEGTHLQWSFGDGSKSDVGAIQKGAAGLKEAGGVGTLFSEPLSAAEIVAAGAAGGMYVRVAAVVDTALTKPPAGAAPDVRPQSHLMGARASSKWKFSAGDHTLTGRRIVYSDTMQLASRASGGFDYAVDSETVWGTIGSESGKGPVSLSDFDALSLLHPEGASTPDFDATGGAGSFGGFEGMALTIIGSVAGVIFIVAVAVGICVYVRRRKKGLHGVRRGRQMFSVADGEEMEELEFLSPNENPRDPDEVQAIGGQANAGQASGGRSHRRTSSLSRVEV